ncbi:NADH:flavin oxidoreductase/NADH oxidase [Guyanagaster necrorhizus]|uniref:NADH:flavin oxidoreductase/NADH oxidase n=1 Tax=Guyanagaster necrorhizus TaxID=856835 RepID=A0A9P7W1A8_9AGAR|nr:NADH:flavin oxidoreductase/NADH oxidase [Guyanagaster necrorhizus MCA 3950]KAG7451471.1 NADH:flavin oxidoreductase/NADH oxidase [Guyanagaster necrorhizus MCA 3950]
MPSAVNKPAPGVSFFSPYQETPSGTALSKDKPIPSLFQPLTIRGVTFQNRIFLSPMCQYSAVDGHITPWHTAHYGGIITRGPGLSIIEATAILANGRTCPEDLGIWSDDHVRTLTPLVELAHSQSQKIGIQLAHGGRKSSTVAPWLSGQALADENVGGWPNDVIAPSPIPWAADYATPKELSKDDITDLLQAYKDGALRAVKAGFDVLEIHAAHGYLLHEFLSPVSNQRTDEYGGSWENRVRLILEIVDAVRGVISQDMPLFFRISGSEGLEYLDIPSWCSEDTVRLAFLLKEHGIDLLDVSSGGNSSQQRIKGAPAYQTPLAHAVKQANIPGLIVSTVGSITNATLAQSILDDGRADVILVGKGFQKNPGLVWAWAEELGVDVAIANQIYWGFYDKFRDVLHQAIQEGLREGVDEVQQNGATQLQNGWMHIHDERNIPPLGRIGDPDDIVASVLVENGNILANTYQPMPAYRFCTSHGVIQLTPGLSQKLRTLLEQLGA